MPEPAASRFDEELADRLMRYCAIDSQSDDEFAASPSTAIQLDMAKLLVAELEEIGAQDVRLTEYGVVLATVPGSGTRSGSGSGSGSGAVLGLCAHMDTAPAYNAAGVKPRLHRRWNGEAITFPDAPGLELSAAVSPDLAGKAGEDIITASGKTLLGADDKAGIAIAMTLARHLLANPDLPRPTLRLAFTPDEEIGRGVDPRLPADLGAASAYTLDGGRVGELELETFSADGAVVRIEGVPTHPGTAKDRLVNAGHLAAKIVTMLPQVTRTPETTSGREGFLHLVEMSGGAAEAELKFILRDFELEGLAAHGDLLRQILRRRLQATEPRARIEVRIAPQYRNMRYWLEDDPRPVALARAAYAAAGITPVEDPIRGGTDGSRLTEMGVPCPNLFTGMHEIHGPLEWISVQDMAKSVGMCLELMRLASEG